MVEDRIEDRFEYSVELVAQAMPMIDDVLKLCRQNFIDSKDNFTNRYPMINDCRENLDYSNVQNRLAKVHRVSMVDVEEVH